MKYPLAITDKLCIGVKARDASLTGIVPSFHGYAHNHACQLDWHPLYIDGTGLEDFEECERTFSRTNELACVTRLATPYHRHQEINQYLMFHDFDKYAMTGWKFLVVTNVLCLIFCVGDFIYQNYRQALEIISLYMVDLKLLEVRTKTTSSDYDRFICKEREYLRALKKERPELDRGAEYIMLLDKLAKATYVTI
jgi:hypothetical protein